MTRSPAASAQTRNRKHRNGKIRLWGCHGSKSSSLPRAQPSPVTAAMATTTAVGPAWRRAITTMPSIEAMLTSATPTASPASGPPNLTGMARTSNSSGPALLTSSPIAIDAEVHEPSNGWCSVSTSAARMLKYTRCRRSPASRR